MKIPLLSGREVLAVLKRMEFREIHRKGSHVKMTHPDGRKIVFPFHDEVDNASDRVRSVLFRCAVKQYFYSFDRDSRDHADVDALSTVTGFRSEELYQR